MEKKVKNLSEPIENFVGNLEALREFLNVMDSFLEKSRNDYSEEKAVDLIPLRIATAQFSKHAGLSLTDEAEQELRREFGTTIEITHLGEHGKFSISVEGDAGKRFTDAVAGLTKNASHQRLLYRNCLISLISSAEWFLSQVLRRFFEAYPDAAGVKDKALTLEDLRKIGSLAEAEAYLITLRVDEIMWGGLDDWLKFLRGTVKLSMGYLEKDDAQLSEVFQRRNVMVHNNGIVHPSYIARVTEDMRKGMLVGQPLGVEADYLKSAINIVEKNFILIAAELWKKVDPKDEKRGQLLNDITMRALSEERYIVSAGASKFQTEDKQLPEKWVLYAKLNLWQTRKWEGRFQEVRQEILDADFSAKEDLVQLARFVLLDEFDEARPLAIAAVETGKLPLIHLEGWPIFQYFRKDAEIASYIDDKRTHEHARLELSQGDQLLEDTQHSLPGSYRSRNI